MTSRRPISSALSAGHHEREVAVGEAQHEVVALLAERFLLLTLLDGGRTVVGVDDLVADVERHDSPCAKTCRNRQGSKFTRRLPAFLTCRSRVPTLRAYPDPMRKALGLLLLLGVVTACVPDPPPGRGPNPTLTVSTVVSGTRSPLGHRVHARRSVDDLRRAGRQDLGEEPRTAGETRFLGGPSDVVVHGEGGLLGLAVDPDFANNHFLYACYDTVVDIRVVRFTTDLSPNSLAVDGAVVHRYAGEHRDRKTLRLPTALPAGHESSSSSAPVTPRPTAPSRRTCTPSAARCCA